MTDTSIILIFMKVPVRGRVKSRLASAVGEDAALELYRNFSLDVIGTVRETGYPFRICFHPPEYEGMVSAWLGEGCSLEAQRGNNLGERMENAFACFFSEGFERAVLIGSDIPDLPASVLHESISSLDTNDLVIGPAFDGGYYLIGFRRQSFLPRLFHGVAWGTGTVFRETMAIVQASGLTAHRLLQWRDIDTIEDLKAFGKRHAGKAFDKSRSMTYLRSIGLA